MCLISYHPPGVPASEEHLRNGMEANTEGFGYALADGGLHAGRSMDPGLLDEFLDLRRHYPDAPAVWHSRLSTGSAAVTGNCHPFAVAGDDQTLVFANGSLPYEPRWLDLTGDCDTRVFAEESFPAIFSDLDDPVTFDMAEKWMTPANKMAIVTVNPRYRENIYIFSRPQWLVTPEGVLHSNQDFAGRGVGWDEEVRDGDLYRWRILQASQCPECHLYHAGDLVDDLVHMRHPAPASEHIHPAWRNESQRRAQVQAAGRAAT